MDKVVSVFRSKTLKLHTTRSWDFLGLTLDETRVIPMQFTYGHDIVVGIFDTGIWPESESFQEKPVMGAIPSSWKGACVEGEEFEPAIACNRKLIGARYYLKGFEEEYGPLNMSASFGATPPLSPFFASSADIGSFHAMQIGITVVFSAGNDGPEPSLVQNVAPWSLCVAASTIDRSFPTEIVLNSNFSMMGQSIISKEIKGKLVNAVSYFVDGVCSLGNWKQRLATGKVVLCFYTPGLVYEIAQAAVKTANGLGLIFAEPFTKPIADVDDNIPTVHVDINQGTKIGNYLAESRKQPVIRISPSKTIIGKSPAPTVVYFSSRGPSTISPDILKVSRKRDTTDDSILAGGSTAGSTPFEMGAGHINPLKAVDPGLIYDMKTSDYILFLCNIGYTEQQINRIVLPCPGVDTSCRKVHETNANLNYPSITIPNLQSPITIKRTVRNVGWLKTAVYFAVANEPDGVEVAIWPRVLIFSHLKRELSYYITLKPLKKSEGRYDFGEIVWSDGFHYVRSPIVVLVNNSGDDYTVRSAI
ncbi:hypothetical protein V6N11_026622 [Hibiscus sabdariffa]|uniref:Subtilisin-like protease fibronectin type-III domain-containing protein n=1 Tax=Hibiscus sabdariffa TaxID=183260 RepID=A0ABR2SW60_9ROSI